MIYNFLFSDYKERLERFSGEAIGQVIAKDFEEAKEFAIESMRNDGFKFCLIFVFVGGEPVKLTIVSLEDEILKDLNEMFKVVEDEARNVVKVSSDESGVLMEVF